MIPYLYWLAFVRYLLTWDEPNDDEDEGTWQPVMPDGGPPLQRWELN